MLSLFKRKNPYVQPARAVYAALLDQARKPVFYEGYGVPDTFDGRFDLLLLHIFCVMHVVIAEHGEDAEDFNQALFDATFADMDQTLREMGIGDMGIPKHMKKMMRAFNGRAHVYQEALDSGNLPEALKTNLYGTVEDVSDKAVRSMSVYVQDTIKNLQAQGVDSILNGTVSFKGDI